MTHSEPLLLVDHDQTEVAELDVFLQKAVRANDDVDSALRNTAQRGFQIFGRLEPAHNANRDRERREALREGFEVLLGEQGGGHEHRGLPVVLDRREGGAHGDLGLAIPDVPADQPVHGLVGLHVTTDVLDRPELVRRLLVFERRVELMGEQAVRREDGPPARLPRRVDGDQVFRHLFDALAHAGLRAAPGCPPQVAELGDLAFGRRVALDLAQPVQRDINHVPAGILDDQVVAVETLNREATEPRVAADPMLDVHDVIADLHLFKGFEERGALGGRRGFVPPAFGEQLVFDDDRKGERGRSSPRAAQPQEPAGQFALH